MTRSYSLLSFTFVSFVMFSSVVQGGNDEGSKRYAINDRIKTVGMCEEYDLNSLTKSDKKLVTKYYPAGKRCPIEKRVGVCHKYKGPDGIAFDMHYYSGTAKGYNWESSSIKVTCKHVDGEYKDG